MKKFRILSIVLVLALVLAITGALFAKTFLTRLANSDDFKRFAEEKVGEYLKAKVSIGEIKPYHFNQIALEKIIIEAPSSKGGSQLIRMDRLLFRYHLSQLWKRQFDSPAGVVLKNPSILITQDEFPYQYFSGGTDGALSFGIPSLDFKGGEIRYRLPAIGKDVLLTDIEGQVTPADDGKVQINIRAKASGVLEGEAAIRGIIDPKNKTHDLWLELDRMDFSSDIPLPFQRISGKIHWVAKDLFFEGVKASLHDWSTELSGSFENFNGKPRTTLHIQVGKNTPWVQMNFVLNLSRQQLGGSILVAGQPPFRYEGKVRAEGKRFIADSLNFNNTLHGNGELDFLTGNYEIQLEDDTRRFAIFSNTRGLDFAIHGRLDHLKLFGMDLVTQGRLYIHGGSTYWENRQFRFKANLETDYFILNQQPFQDLKGSFEISPYGITGIRCNWGRKFEMTGKITFPSKKPEAKLALRAANFDLADVHFFAAKPLPKEIGGLLDGKVLIEGDLRKPEFIGTFNIRDGKWGKLDYDRGIIQIRGFPPYFPLHDSKIWRGRSTFFLQGAVDLGLDNIFAGVKIETPDSLIVWKGLDVTLHKKEGSIGLKRKDLGKYGDLSALEVESAKRPASYSGDPNDERKDQAGVVIGPKLNF